MKTKSITSRPEHGAAETFSLTYSQDHPISRTFFVTSFLYRPELQNICHLFSPTSWSLPVGQHPATLFIHSRLHLQHTASCKRHTRGTNPPQVIKPQDGSCKVCQNVGKPASAYSWKPKPHFKVQQQKPKDQKLREICLLLFCPSDIENVKHSHPYLLIGSAVLWDPWTPLRQMPVLPSEIHH
jgi:hypothetical protein